MKQALKQMILSANLAHIYTLSSKHASPNSSIQPSNHSCERKVSALQTGEQKMLTSGIFDVAR